MPIKTVILSLPKDAERRRLCAQELALLGLSHEFSDAISGAQLDQKQLATVYDAQTNKSKFKRPLSANEVACTLGHRKIWQSIASSDDKVCLVLEDDATFMRDPRPFLKGLTECPGQFEDVMIKLDGVPGRNMQTLASCGDHNLVMSDRLPPRTTGYILGRRAAARLLEFKDPITRPVDISLKFYWEHKVPILTLDTQMVTERENCASNIDACRRHSKPGSPLSRFLRNLAYQARYTHGRLSNPLIPAQIEGLSPLLTAKNKARTPL